ncbi:hypothetical protein CP532_4739 [Ophiocordyceps camponoti-leonardi (nom. inval.)]|nr:hypothetical protein CP532_4739 [Ophiocordyceps camponoti-leonardi (nom. inval.)]
MIFYARMFLALLLLCTRAVAVSAACDDAIAPRFTPEADSWHLRFHESELGNLSAVAVASPGLSMLFPHVKCTQDGFVCQATVGEGEINAAASMTALALSPYFHLAKTYFLLAGIAGVNPREATLGSVALSRFAVQAALQYEIDPRSLPANWSTGYIPYGRSHPFEYPAILYGTEVFELNVGLRDAAAVLASRASLVDDDTSRRYRAMYARGDGYYAKATQPPSVVKCDCITSDVYYSGNMLSQAFENTTRVWTNGTGAYCMTAQEDSAILEVMVRAAVEGLVDFSRVMLMRTASDFDRPPPGVSDLHHLTRVDQNGFRIATANLYIAGIEIVKGIVAGWNSTYLRGHRPPNYVGDIFGTLGGSPDFGPGSRTGGEPVRSAVGRRRRRSLAVPAS